jgi:hypothetical protein
MATIIDEAVDNDQDHSDVNELDNLDEQSTTEVDEGVHETHETQSQSQEEDSDLPDKYRGKSAKDIARMHQEAEKALGRQGSEVGELRRLVDDFIKSQTVSQRSENSSTYGLRQQTQSQAPANDDVDEVDFFADPKAAISKAIEKHPKVRAAEELTLNMKKAEAMATLKAQHPDFQDIVQAPDFAEWIGKSKVRQELFLRADQAYDFDAANELLTTYKERKAVVEGAKAVEKVERKQAVKAASTGSTRGSSEGASRKTYRRADIIDLMVRNPERYAALSDEIMKAYSEGRVK